MLFWTRKEFDKYEILLEKRKGILILLVELKP